CTFTAVGENLQTDYRLQQILDSKLHWGKLCYPFDWQGYRPKECTWKPAENMHAPAKTTAFQKYLYKH
uniref:Chromo domain-containing protein n=1 Tax=Apteryx owenii TaxID=8824 RepID=A0A8B9NPZ3_APTOW